MKYYTDKLNFIRELKDKHSKNDAYFYYLCTFTDSYEPSFEVLKHRITAKLLTWNLTARNIYNERAYKEMNYHGLL